MHRSLTRTPRSRAARLTAFLAAVVATAGLMVPLTVASADPPPNPSDNQLSAAARAKANLANQVGQLAVQTAQIQQQLNQLNAAKELAEQKLALALEKLQQSKDAAAQAKANVQKAQQSVVNAQDEFNAYVQAVYMGGNVTGTTGALLTASDPNALLARGALETYQATHQLDAIGDLQRAGVDKSNADAVARATVQAQSEAALQAQQAQAAAVIAVNQAKAQQQQLQAALRVSQAKYDAAQLQLKTLQGERSKYLSWQAEQRRIAEERRLAALRAAAAAAAAARASGGGGGGGGGGGTYVPPGPIGHWTAAAGRTAVQRAERWLGTPYAWAGGNAQGPTYGVCAGDGAFNDCNVVGFDCSGLVMYAWAQYPFAHYAATQYTQGSVHPNVGSLMPGDLVFWSSDGTIGGIHHVAIYIGGGNVIQAPESGDVIKITPLDQVDWGYFGATRPLT